MPALVCSCAQCRLRAICLPADLGDGDMERLDGLVERPPPLDRGDRLIAAGAPFEHVYVVRSGSLKTVRPGDGGGDQVVGFHLAADFLGLDAISHDRYCCDAVALERTSVCAIPFERLAPLATEQPALQRQLHRVISRQMQVHYQHLAALGRGHARERMATFINGLSRRLAYVGQSPFEFHLSMARADIASYLGLAAPTVSRALGQLSDAGMLEIERRRIRILDPALAGEPGHREPRAAHGSGGPGPAARPLQDGPASGGGGRG